MDDFLPGDKVEFIDDNIQGVVISIIDNQKVLILIDEGLEIPVHKSEIVNITATKSRNKERKIKEDEQVQTKSDLENQGIFIGLQRADNEKYINYYLINNTKYFIYFTFYSQEEEKLQPITKGDLNPWQFKLLTNFDLTLEASFPTYTIQILTFHSGSENIPDPMVFSFKPNAKSIHRNISLAPIMNQEVSLYKITPIINKNTIRISDVQREEKPIVDVDKPLEIVDLHADKLGVDHISMNKSEILKYQLSHFQTSLEKAIAFGYKRIIFIHGIGNFTLKNIIAKDLKNNKFVEEICDADIRKYGFGATEVILSK